MKIPSLSLKTIVLLAGLIIVPCTAHADDPVNPADKTANPGTTPQKPAPKIFKLTLIAGSQIVVNPDGAKQELLTLRNNDKEMKTVSLNAVISPTSNTVPRIKFKINEKDPGDGEAVLPISIPANGVTKVWALVSDVPSVGEFGATLKDQNEEIENGTIKLIRLPFAVKLDDTNPEKFAMVDGSPTDVVIKNDDPVAYPLIWRLSINGEEVCGGQFTLAASGVGVLRCKASIPFSPSRVQDFIKEQAAKGNMVLLYGQTPNGVPDLASPWKTIPIQQATLTWAGPFTRQTTSYILIIVVLILGGLASLVLSHALPNRLQKLNVREQLDRIARTAADLSSNVESKLQVMLRVERSRLSELLQSRTTISPDFDSIAKRCCEATAKLASRVALVPQLDIVLGQLSKARGESAPPTLIDDIDASLKKANLLLSKGQPADEDLAAAQATIVDAAGKVDNLRQPDVTFGEKLRKRALQVKADIDQNLKDKSEAFKRLNNALPGLYATLDRVPPGENELTPDRYTLTDMAIEKILLIKEYARTFELTTDAERLDRLQQREPALRKSLQLNSWESLRSARLLVREMGDDVYPERFDEVLRAQEASIDMDPNVANERSQVEFCVCFQNAIVNSAAAREELTCNWDFGDGWRETGWTVAHYFQLRGANQPGVDLQSTQSATEGDNLPPRHGTGEAKIIVPPSKSPQYTVTATFITAAGKLLADPTTNQPVKLVKTVEVMPSARSSVFGERSRTEGLKLGAALLIAIFGLIAGAQEQLLKLDILPGLIAVFLVGFGADTIKSLLTTKS